MTDFVRADAVSQDPATDSRATRKIAEALIGSPGAIERTLEQHISTADGRCTKCGNNVPAAKWPCMYINAALLARVIASGAT